MTELEAQNVVDGIFTSENFGVPIYHDNEKFDGSSDAWLRVVIRNAGGKQITLGSDNPLFRYHSLCIVQIFVRPNTGTAQTNEIVGMITSLLRSKNVQGLHFSVPVSHYAGTDDGWYQTNVTTPFYRED